MTQHEEIMGLRYKPLPNTTFVLSRKDIGKNHPFIIKDSDLEVEGNYLNLKATMKMPTVKSHPLEK